MDRSSPQPLGSVLQSVIDDLDIQDKIDEARAIETWAHLVGASVNRVTSSVWMRDGVLHVEMQSSAWRSEIYNNREMWRQRINDEFDREVVTSIRLH